MQPQRVPAVSDLRHARIGDAIVDFTANRIQRDGSDLRVTPKAMAVLRELAVRPLAAVKRDDLLGLVWRDGFPTDDVLTHAITELRRALETDPRAPLLIETVPRIGYRLTAPVEPIEATPRVAVEASAPVVERPPAPTIERHDEPRRRARSDRTPRVVAAIVVLAVVALGVFAWLRDTREPDATAMVGATTSQADPNQPLASNIRALTTDPQAEMFPSLSPDGASVVYVTDDAALDRTRLMVRSVDLASAPTLLAESPADTRDDFPVWSPDGTRIAFLRFRQDACEIRVIPALGGDSRRVGVCRPRIVDYIDWTPDGRAILLTRWRERTTLSPSVAVVHRLDLATGEVREMPIDASPSDSDIQPRPSPDARWLAFRRGAAPYSDLWIVPYAGGAPRALTSLKSRMRGFAWYPDSRHVLVSSDHEGRQALYRIAIDDGAIEPLGIMDAHFPNVARHEPVAVFQQEVTLVQLKETKVEGAEPGQPIAPSTRSDTSPRYSPDGTKLAFVSARSGDAQLWIHDFVQQTAHQVTRHERAEIGVPRWSPDGTQLLHVLRGNGRSRLAIAEVGSGRVRYVGTESENIRFGSWSRDGRFIDFASDRGGRWQPWRVPVAGGEPQRLSETEAVDPQDPLGDGHVYFSRENERGLFRVSLANGVVERVSDAIGLYNVATWDLRPDGLYYLDLRGENLGWGLYRTAIATDKPEREELRFFGALSLVQMALSPDASRVVTPSTVRDDTDLVAVDLRLR